MSGQNVQDTAANLCILCGHDSDAHCFHAHAGQVSCCTLCPEGTCSPPGPLCCARYGKGHAPEFATQGCPGPRVVWDVDADCSRTVSREEAAAGMLRYARTLGPGSPACGEAERRALALLRGEGDA